MNTTIEFMRVNDRRRNGNWKPIARIKAVLIQRFFPVIIAKRYAPRGLRIRELLSGTDIVCGFLGASRSHRKGYDREIRLSFAEVFQKQFLASENRSH